MEGGTPTPSRSRVESSLNSLTLGSQDIFSTQDSGNSSDCKADIVAASSSGGSGELPSNLTRFHPAAPHQGTFPVHVSEFDDAPYIPPRVTRAELATYVVPDPRVSSVYDPTQQFAYGGGISPSDSIESNWSGASSSSSASSQFSHGYDSEPSQYSQTLRPTRAATHPQRFSSTFYGPHHHFPGHARFAEQHSNTTLPHHRTPHHYSNLLAPEIYGDTTAQISTSPQVHMRSSQAVPSTSFMPATNRHPNIPVYPGSPLADDDTGPYLRQQLGLSAEQSVTLRSLPDPSPGEKPLTPLPMLIKLAIYGSPMKQLTLQEIYTELEDRFQWFRDHRDDKAWKNSIRHNLSLNKVFKRVARPASEPGKGSYWKLDVSGGEGYKRTRKRRPRGKSVPEEEDEDEETSETDDRPTPVDPTARAGPSRSSTVSAEDNIDPELRAEGHMVGESRSRSVTRRVGGNPYPQQSPRYQQTQLPVTAGPDASAAELQFGRPAFGFVHYPQPPSRPVQFPPSASSFAAVTSPSMAMAPPTLAVAIPSPSLAHAQRQQVGSYDRVPQPASRSSVEHAAGPGGAPGGVPASRTMRTQTHPKSQGQSQDHARVSSAGSSSSGSSRTWKNVQSRSQ